MKNNKKNKNNNGQPKEKKGKDTQWKKQEENCLFPNSPNGPNGSRVFNDQLNNYSNTFSMNYMNLMVPVPAANPWFNQTAAIFSSHSTSDAMSTKHVLNPSFSPSASFNVFIPLITNRRALIQQQELAFEQLRQQQEQEQKKQESEQQQTRPQKQSNKKLQTQKRKRKEKGSQRYQNKRKEPQGHQQEQQKERTFRLKRPEEKIS